MNSGVANTPQNNFMKPSDSWSQGHCDYRKHPKNVVMFKHGFGGVCLPIIDVKSVLALQALMALLKICYDYIMDKLHML